MAYRGNYNNSQRNNSNGNRRNNNGNQDNQSKYDDVLKPLHEYYKDSRELYLPGGKADQYAQSFKGITSHQVRKLLDGVKEAKAYSDAGEFDLARKTLYALVAMTAYNSGRDPKNKPLYQFIKATVNQKSIVSKEDINTCDELLTSIVAYHRINNG